MNSSNTTYATQETIDLFLNQKYNNGRGTFQPVKLNEKFKFEPDLPEVDVELIPSGHILGSASVLLEYAEKRILFSSDIGGKGLSTINQTQQRVQVDTLIVEATFGSPEIQFQPREEISMDIIKWSAAVIKEKRNVVLSAGKIGCAQELIKLFNDFTKLRVITHDDVTAPSDVYKKHGVALEFVDSKSDEGREIIKEGEAVIIQSRSKKIVPYFMTEHVKHRSAIVTGMASRFRYKDFDASFPLSSHASYAELIDYISEVSPAMVFTIYGFEKKLAEAISSKLKIPAIPLKDKEKQLDSEFNPGMSHFKTKPKHVLEKDKLTLQKSPMVQSDTKKEKTLDDFFKTD